MVLVFLVRNYERVIIKAKGAYKIAREHVEDHFPDVRKMVNKPRVIELASNTTFLRSGR
jgi:hypothetical protein